MIVMITFSVASPFFLKKNWIINLEFKSWVAKTFIADSFYVSHLLEFSKTHRHDEEPLALENVSVSETEAWTKPALMPPWDETLLLVCLRRRGGAHSTWLSFHTDSWSGMQGGMRMWTVIARPPDKSGLRSLMTAESLWKQTEYPLELTFGMPVRPTRGPSSCHFWVKMYIFLQILCCFFFPL